MRRTNLIALILIALNCAALAANTPQELVRALAQSAHNRDVESFIANMTTDSQRALADAEVAQTRVMEARAEFEKALDQRFGKSNQVRPPEPPDRAAVLSRFVDIELVGVQQETPRKVLMQLKTVLKGPGERLVTQEATLPATEEGGSWKLDLTELTRGGIPPVAKREAAFHRVAQEVRNGAFRDRFSALVALAKAERGGSGRY